MSDPSADACRAQDLEQRIQHYETMERLPHWPGALDWRDYLALALLCVALLGLSAGVVVP